MIINREQNKGDQLPRIKTSILVSNEVLAEILDLTGKSYPSFARLGQTILEI